jgi:hypothetical protein
LSIVAISIITMFSIRLPLKACVIANPAIILSRVAHFLGELACNSGLYSGVMKTGSSEHMERLENPRI